MILKFITRFFLYSLPILGLFSLYEYLMYASGESISIEKVVNRQQQEKDLLYERKILGQQFNLYKYHGIVKVKPEILVVGSSRVLKFRDFSFAPLQHKFYNAGSLLQNAEDLNAFAEWIQKGKISPPKTIIIGIDPWWYKSDYLTGGTWLNEEDMIDDAFKWQAHCSNFKKLPKLFSAWKNSDFEEDHYYGLGAISQKSGLRFDGSRKIATKQLLKFKKNPIFIDRESPPVINRILEARTSRFSLAEIDASRFALTLEALEKIEKKGIEILLYFPPFSSESYFALEQSSGQMREWWKFYKEDMVKLLSQKYNYIAPSYPKAYSLGDEYMIDGFHPSEVFVAIQLKKYFEHDYKKQSQNLPYLSQLNFINLDSLLKLETTIPISFQKG